MSVTVTGTVQQRAWAERVLPPVERVRPGVWSIPVPIPDNPMRYVLVYAFEEPDGVTLIDAGWDAPEAWQALQDGLAQIGGSVADVTGVLVTHAHHDHFGLGARLQEASGAWLAMHAEEAAHLPRSAGDVPRSAMLQHWIELGAPTDEAELVVGGPSDWARFRALPDPDRLLEDGASVLTSRDLRAIWTPGHTPGHLCFHLTEDRVLFSGDHLLPRITPNISLYRGSSTHPLRDFLTSLESVASLDVDEVMPGHEYRFAGLGERAEQLRTHHEHRLAEILRCVATFPGCSTWHAAASVTWSRTWDEMPPRLRTFAVGEVRAHLQLLEERGRVVQRGGAVHEWYYLA